MESEAQVIDISRVSGFMQKVRLGQFDARTVRLDTMRLQVRNGVI